MHASRIMNGDIVLGRLWGIRVQLNFSLIFIFLLLLFNLGAGVLPRWHPTWTPGLIWSVALAAALLFFCSILVHELSHALVARRNKIPVRSITLFLFGGVANIEQEPDSPRVEASMAAIGPVVSIGIGILFTALAGILTGQSDVASAPEKALANMGPLETLLAWLGPVNIVLGIFNLLPAFPLDGGRVTRAFLWAVIGDLARATRWATRLSQCIAWLLIAAGIAMSFGVHVPFFGRGMLSGLWLAFIGWFLNNAAVASYRQVKIRNLLQDVSLRTLMRRPLPPLVASDTRISDFVETYAVSSSDSVFPVAVGDTVVGVIDVDAVRKLPRAAWSTTAVREVMTPLTELPSIDRNEDAYDAVRRLGNGSNKVLAVFDSGRFLGLLQHEDIARWLELQAGLERSTALMKFSSRHSA